MSTSGTRRVKSNSVQLRVGFLMIATVMLLTVVSYLLYRNLSQIVSSIRIEKDPEMSLLTIREISADIEKAGNSVRIYTVTGNQRHIWPYYTFVREIDEKVTRLRTEFEGDSVLLAQTDTISVLIGDNIVIWNKLLALHRDDNVIGDLRQLSEQLDSVSVIPRKEGIIRRVFNRETDTTSVEKVIAADLNTIVEQNQAKRDEMARRELQLANNSSEISAKFYELIRKMETEINESIAAKAEEAAKIADKTYRWLILLVSSGGLLALMVIYTIIRYARNANAYQIALEESKSVTEKLARTKEMFMANMSHEIRTPVTAISGFTEQLLNEIQDEGSLSSLKIIKSSSDHLLRIIDDILDYSKLQNDKLTLEKVHFMIGPLMDEVCRMFEKQSRKNNTTISCYLNPETPGVLIGDPYRLRQIMMNLVSNSVKFTKNGSVYFAINSAPKGPDEVELTMEVSDTGIGIDESRINAVFEDFTQAEMSTTRKYGGTGLGLSTVKKLVELHKGTIDLSSKKNRGTIILCRIPLMVGDEKQIKTETAKVTSGIPEEIRSLKVLVADDEEYNRMLFRKIFDTWKVKCSLAENGMEALELLKEEKFDLVFMDLLMPGIDGIKTTRFIRDEMKISSREMPVILISAAPVKEDWQMYLKAGVNSYLTKPFMEQTLLAVLMETLQDGNNGRTEDDTTVEEKKPETAEKINLSNLNHISGGDQQFVRQMLESFITTTSRGLKAIREETGRKNWDAAADQSHRIQPPCRHIGAMELYSILRNLEKSMRERENTEAAGIVVEKACQEFEEIKTLINEHITNLA